MLKSLKKESRVKFDENSVGLKKRGGQVLNEMSGKEFSYIKNKLSEALVEIICPIGDEIKQLLDDKTHLEGVLKKGREKAHIKAEENLKKIREIVGLI